MCIRDRPGTIPIIFSYLALSTAGNALLPSAIFTIAYMGYATREIHLAKRKKQGDLRVTLREDSQQLKEVVVTAMGIKV